MNIKNKSDLAHRLWRANFPERVYAPLVFKG